MTLKKVTCMHITKTTVRTVGEGVGIGGWLRYLWAVFCRFPAAKL